MGLAEMVDLDPRDGTRRDDGPGPHQGLHMPFASETAKGQGGLEAPVHVHDAAAVDGLL